MLAVVDTNVWVSGLILPDGVAGRILGAIRRRQLLPVVSWELAEEISDVLSRPRLAVRYGIGPGDLDDVVFVLAPSLPRADVAVPVRDPDDAPVISAAIVGRADAIVTGDEDLHDPSVVEWLAARNVEVLTPRETLERLTSERR